MLSYFLYDILGEDKTREKDYWKSALKKEFIGPYANECEFAGTFFAPVVDPIAFAIVAAGTFLGALVFTARAIKELPFDSKKSLKNADIAAKLLAISIGSLLLAAISPVIAIMPLIGRTVATFVEDCKPSGYTV